MDRRDLKFKDGEKKIVHPTGYPHRHIHAGGVTKNDLKPGVKIFIAAAQKQPDGSLTGAAREFRARMGSRRRCMSSHSHLE